MPQITQLPHHLLLAAVLAGCWCSASSSSASAGGCCRRSSRPSTRARRRSPTISSAPRRRAPRPTKPKPRGGRAWTRPRRGRAAGPGGQAEERPGHRGQGARRRPTRSTPRSKPPRRKIRESLDAARAEIEAVAAEATQEMVAAPDRHQGRQQGSRGRGEGGNPCLSRRLSRRPSSPGPARGRADRVRACAADVDRAGDARRHRDHDLEEGAGRDRQGARQQDRADPRPARRGGIAAQGSRGAEGRI